MRISRCTRPSLRAATGSSPTRPRCEGSSSSACPSGRGMREAIANDEIVPFYQPKVSLSTGEIVGLEALARWRHPSEGHPDAGLLRRRLRGSRDRSVHRQAADVEDRRRCAPMARPGSSLRPHRAQSVSGGVRPVGHGRQHAADARLAQGSTDLLRGGGHGNRSSRPKLRQRIVALSRSSGSMASRSLSTISAPATPR